MQKNRMWVGISYLVLACMNLVFLATLWELMAGQDRTVHSLMDVLRATGFPAIWVIVNIPLSVVVGVGVIFGGLSARKSGLPLILLGFLLVALDLVPVFQFMRQSADHGYGGLPWTIIPLAFHVFLEFAMVLAFRRNNKRNRENCRPSKFYGANP